MPTPPPDNLLWSHEVCDQLGIDRSTLSRWVKEGRIIPAMRLPGARGPMLFAPADVAKLKAETAA